MIEDHRLDPITDEAWPDSIEDMRNGFAGRLNVYRTMAHHPALLRAWAPLREHIVNQSALGPILSEVAILRIGFHLESSYELSHHIDRARRLGLDDARLVSILGEPGATEPLDRLITTAVDELFDLHALTSETLEALCNGVGSAAIFDLMATVGFYSTLGYILNSFNIPLDADVALRLRQRPLDMQPL